MSQAQTQVYGFHDRTWHWIQAFAILGLLATGFALRFPERSDLDLTLLLSVHLGLAGFLLLNAVLGLFYFLTSGLIRHYVPRPREVFTLSILQARYYLWGIFRGAPHPFERSPSARLNALQQLTYLGILNVLLPLMVLSGAALWGEVSGAGSARLHALGAWLFASFVTLHVYLTTTGETPLANLRAMVTGVEAAEAEAEAEAETTPQADPGPEATS